VSLKSVKVRFAVSLASNGARAGISCLTGLLLARALKPISFGDFSFLLGSFFALRLLLDLGASNAFFTLIAGRSRSRKLFGIYFGWLGVQFVVTAAAIMLFPGGVVRWIWLGHSRGMIMLAFLASFLQQQVWLTIGQIGESERNTVRVQILNISVAAAHFGLVLVLIVTHKISIIAVFSVMILEYILVTAWAYGWLRPEHTALAGEHGPDDVDYRTIIHEFVVYCRPLALFSVASFLYNFADRWMLQQFGGSRQQGFYQVSYQVASISLLATISMVSVFWKEVAEAHARGDLQRVAFLYRRVSRSLVMCSAVASAFVIPWTRELVALVLGPNYLLATPVLAIMFLYPVHQALGQICSIMLLASGNTRTHTLISIPFLLLSLPIAYLMQAPRTAMLPGFGLGATGMALKMVLLNIISVNVTAYVIARLFSWKFDWLYQVVGVVSALALSVAAKYIACFFWQPVVLEKFSLLVSVGLAGVIYLSLIAALLWFQPWLIGMDRDEVVQLSQKVRRAFAR
jgi:O-antigen/teichoic acid export membrane protein